MPTSMLQVSQPVTHTVGQPLKQGLQEVPRKSGGQSSGQQDVASKMLAQYTGQSLRQSQEFGARKSGVTGKVNDYGIEVVEGIVWSGWEPGKEYTKSITLKNVKVKTQKIKYNVPSSRFFTTLYPKPIVLSAGTSFSLPVTFRPLEKTLYEDKIQFHTKEGVFDVPIKAVLPQYDIDVPDKINFNMCAARDLIEANFDVTNSGDLETELQWELVGPFTIEPTEVKLKAKQTYTFKAIFKPMSATVYEAEAVCKYGTELSLRKTSTLYGIGKYPHLLVSTPGKPSTSLVKDDMEAIVQFGPTPVGSTVTRMVELHNLSAVGAPFKIDQPTGVSRIDTVYRCPKTHGVVPPVSSVKIPIEYSPNTVDVTSIDYFNIVAIGNISRSVIKCVGSSKGPTVSLSSNVVNFMQVDMGDVATRTVEIFNGSDTDARYQFVIDCNESVFKFEKTHGVLKPDTKQTIILKFVPQYPINYHRRVTCLVHNHVPLFLDILGTCHSELMKPAVLLSKHLDRFRCHVERGFSLFPPEQLNELRREGRLELDDAGALMAPEIDSEEKPPLQLPVVPPMDEYFSDGFHCDVINFVPHVSLDINLADFGSCQNLRVIEDKMLNLTNHTKGKVTVQWIGDTTKTFSVMPASVDIPPLKSCTFHISFKPNAPNQFYGAELECYVYYKSLRDYKLVEDTTHSPPWCLTLNCTGQTFLPNNETFLPRYTLDTPPLVFPAVNTNESDYRTLLMTNTGTTPILFDVEKDPTNTYSVKPCKALLKGQHQIFVVKIKPKEVKTYKQKLMLKLNDNKKFDQELQLWGSAEAPQVLMDTQGEMYFKQTCVGTSSQRNYIIKNISRIPLRASNSQERVCILSVPRTFYYDRFEWKRRYTDRDILFVTPESGIIQPNESLSQTWSFVPKEEKKYLLKPSLIVWGQGFSATSSGGKKKQFDMRVVGEGTIGDIKAEQSYIDFGDIIVGSSSSRHITLFNNSTCSLYYRLFIDQTMDGPYPEEITKDDKPGLELERMEGVIPARSRQVISATVRPIRRVTYQFAVSYQLITPEGDVSQAAREPQHLCHVLTTGVFPVMSVTDARCYGSAIGVSKKQLWSLFSLDNFNVCLDSDPSARELLYSVNTRHSHHKRPPVYTRAIMDFNFSAAPLGSEPCVVNLMFENTGTVPTEWAFLFPSDLQLELEYWAETGEYDEDELHEMKVMDNKLFTIEPKKGTMQPGDCQTVTFMYKHTMAGTDRLPVLLKLARGREILLNFIGVTVEPERRYIHFPASKHLFTPVPVGEKVSPKQIYELYNGGAVPVQYEFDLTPLELLKQENFDQPILECVNPRGEIPPGRSLSVEWRFSPVEAKTYMVDVPIHVHNGDTAIVTFTGVGYDKRIMGDTMPMTDQQDLSGVPGVQSVPVPGQLAYLSQERISFGNLPLFSRGRRMVFIMNKSRDRPVSFEWHVTCPTEAQYLSIAPIRGKLEPGESRMCRVAFVACGSPSFYDLDLVCEVTDEVEYGDYKRRLRDWERERERQKYEFTITEEDLYADERLGDVEVTERPPSRLKSVEERMVSDTELTRYKTLPPIKNPSPDEVKEIGYMKRKKEEELWEKPEPPIPFLLHLGLTARTHDIREFQENFQDDYKHFFIDRCLSENFPDPAAKKKKEIKTPDVVECTRAESEVVSGVLSNVLRGLLDDTQFHDSVKKVIKDPIPYFIQIGERPESISRAPTPSEQGERTPVAVGEISPVSSASSVGRTPHSQASSAASRRSQPPGSPTMSSTEREKVGPRHTKEELKKVQAEEQRLKHKQQLKKIAEFGNTTESIIENTVLNIMSEALSGEFNITARPRFIALPRRSGSGQSRGGK